MKTLLSLCLALIFTATASGQFFKSETTRKAGEKLKLGDQAGAIAILDKAIEQRKDLLEAHQMRASLRSMSGNLDGAIEDYTAALKIDPGLAYLYQRRAKFRMFKRDSAGALADLDLAVANGLKTETVFVDRARVKRDMGDIAGAITDFELALGLDPNRAAAVIGLATIMERSGNVDGAIERLQTFLDRYEANRGKLPEMRSGALLIEGVVVKREGKEKDGTQAYMTTSRRAAPFTARSQEEMELFQARQEQLMNLVHAYANLGRLYAKKGDEDRALATYNQGLEINKQDYYIHKLRAEIRINKGDLAGAIEDLTFVANSGMSSPDKHFDKGLLLLLQGKEAEAEEQFVKHRQIFPGGAGPNDKRIIAVRKLLGQSTP